MPVDGVKTALFIQLLTISYYNYIATVLKIDCRIHMHLYIALMALMHHEDRTSNGATVQQTTTQIEIQFPETWLQSESKRNSLTSRKHDQGIDQCRQLPLGVTIL